jgi:hypothetical protein
MTGHTLSVGLIYLCTCAAWWILGTTIYMRSNEAPSQQRQGVESAWGKPQRQQSPRIWYCGNTPAEGLPGGEANGRPGGEANGRPTDAVANADGCTIPAVLTQSRISTGLDLQHRRKGLAWFSTYAVDFRAAYRVANTSTQQRRAYVEFSLPAGQSVFDGFTATLSGQDISQSIRNSILSAYRDLAPGEELVLQVTYRSQGLDQWTYALPTGVSRVNDFQLTMRTNFPRIDFPAGTLAATSRAQNDEGWNLEWSYESLLTDLSIGMAMPARLQPGDLAGRITFFAPVALLFYFFLMLMLTLKRGIALHAMNYFFLATAFFAFHLLLAYTVDHIDIHVAFLLSAAVSIFLAVSYLRLVAGMRFALLDAGLLQFIYLVGFSYSFFLEGYSALCVTVASIITLYVVMQLTAKVDWAAHFARRRPASAMPPPPPTPAMPA